MRVVIIGTGNVATVFGKMLVAAGYTITQVFGRNAAYAEELAGALNSLPCTRWQDIHREADLYLVAMSDKSLYELDRYLAVSNQLVVHTAGSVPGQVLKNITPNYGVLYPVQSLRKEMPVLTAIPLLVDASNERSLQQVWQVAASLSSQVSQASDDQRLKLHVAAVFINNFSNHLYAVAEDICEKEAVPFRLLLPLLAETAGRMQRTSARQVLTGPAIRNDQVTIQKHLNVLHAHPVARTLYRQITDSIQAFHHNP